ncbi:MAG: bifunctional phosphoribosyl-AMP cyclohydrolase/phosphoribosyl-ATP diphosphatase HisIE [Bdellovibrionales bacterium]
MKIDFEKSEGLVPAIIQDATSLRVLMLGYMNEEAFRKTKETGFVTFFSRSRQCLWQKGETSGNKLEVVEIRTDCDNDTLLIFANAYGPTCHTGSISCFGETETNTLSILADLEKKIKDRKENPKEGSYTNELFAKGLSRIAQKVGEEGIETALAGATKADNLSEEAADLFYHLLVLLTERNLPFKAILDVLHARAKNLSK